MVNSFNSTENQSRISFNYFGASIPIIGTVLILGASSIYSTTGGDFQNAKILASLLALAACLPMALHVGNKLNHAPLFALNCMYYVFGYSLGPFFSNLDRKFAILSSEVDFPLAVCFIGLGSQVIGYHVANNIPYRCPTVLKMPNIGGFQVGVLGWVMLIASQIPSIFPEILKVPSVGQAFRLFLYSGVAIVGARSLGLQGRFVEKFLFAVVLATILIGGLLSGLSARALQIGLILAVAAGAMKKMFTGFLLLAISCLVLFLVNPIKTEYRQIYWRSDDTIAIQTKAFVFAELVIDYWSKPQSIRFSEKDNLLTIDRINQFPILARVVSMTPEEVPYWKGDSFSGIMYGFIPRIVWPNKPERTFGNQFGHRYFFLNPTDSTTSFNLPWLVEFYANLGVFGVVVAFVLLGAFFRYAEKWFLTMTGDNISNTLMVGLFAPLAFPESDFVVMFGTIFLGILTLKGSTILVGSLFGSPGR